MAEQAPGDVSAGAAPVRAPVRARVRPRLPRGTFDLLPAAAAARWEVVGKVRAAFEAHGFAPLATPALEYRETLLGPGGEEASGQTFRVESDEADGLGLRFDLTVPFARVVALHQQTLPRPFRRYQVGPVWRLDKPGPGRFREFVQFDADIAGTTSAVADAECVATLRDALRAVAPAPAGTAPRFRIRMSDRRLLDAMLERAGLPLERSPEVLRVIDKLDRVGLEKVRLELTGGYEDESGDRIKGLGFDPDGVARVVEWLQLAAPGRRDALDLAADFLGPGERSAAAVAALREFSGWLADLGVGDDEAGFDLSIARGLAYYTGPVFEAVLLAAPAMGSVASGGRYDDLVGRFSGQAWPGVGVSLGIDRLLAALEQAGGAPAPRPPADVLVATVDAGRLDAAGGACAELRAAGLRVELFAGPPGTLGRQFKYADRAGIEVVVLAGPDEMARGAITVKQMREPAAEAGPATREGWLAARVGQREVPRQDLVRAVLEALGRESAP